MKNTSSSSRKRNDQIATLFSTQKDALNPWAGKIIVTSFKFLDLQEGRNHSATVHILFPGQNNFNDSVLLQMGFLTL